MFHRKSMVTGPGLTLTLALTAGAAIADTAIDLGNPQTAVSVMNAVPTDAIRVEVEEAGDTLCVAQVLWAFNLPEGNLIYTPHCEVIEGRDAYTEARRY